MTVVLDGKTIRHVFVDQKHAKLPIVWKKRYPHNDGPQYAYETRSAQTHLSQVILVQRYTYEDRGRIAGGGRLSFPDVCARQGRKPSIPLG